MTTKCAAAVLAIAGLLLTADVSPAVALTCSAAPVSAKGEASRYRWLAKTKAHANWRAAVRAMADLGPDYANWRRAADAADDCSEKAGAFTCVFTGTPCKP